MLFRNIFTVSIFFILVFGEIASAKIVDKIVAVVNDEVITQSEIDRVLYPVFLKYTKAYKGEQLYKKLDEARLDILKQLINDKLILTEAKKQKIEVKEKEIDRAIELLKKDLSNKGLDFNNMLKEQNFALSDLRKRYKEQIMIQKIVEQKIGSKIDIQPSEINNYYLNHIEDYTQPEQVAVYTILIKLKSKRTPEESRQLIEDIYKMLMEGADFKALAKNYSEGPHRKEGGDLGYIQRGELLKEIDDVIFQLDVGEISNIIKTPIGYYIFKVYDRRNEKILPYEEVHQKIKELLYRIKFQNRLDEWLEELKSNAYISIK